MYWWPSELQARTAPAKKKGTTENPEMLSHPWKESTPTCCWKIWSLKVRNILRHWAPDERILVFDFAEDCLRLVKRSLTVMQTTYQLLDQAGSTILRVGLWEAHIIVLTFGHLDQPQCILWALARSFNFRQPTQQHPFQDSLDAQLTSLKQLHGHLGESHEPTLHFSNQFLLCQIQQEALKYLPDFPYHQQQHSQWPLHGWKVQDTKDHFAFHWKHRLHPIPSITKSGTAKRHVDLGESQFFFRADFKCTIANSLVKT